jgi:hypothetical protein
MARRSIANYDQLHQDNSETDVEFYGDGQEETVGFRHVQLNGEAVTTQGSTNIPTPRTTFTPEYGQRINIPQFTPIPDQAFGGGGGALGGIQVGTEPTIFELRVQPHYNISLDGYGTFFNPHDFPVTVRIIRGS